MILKHYIQTNNNEEILIIHLDYNYEFSKFDNSGKGIIHNITEYIHTHKIKFNGNKVVLIVGSLVLGTLILNPINYNEPLNLKKPYTYVSKITLANYNNKNELKSIREINTEDKTVKEKTITKKESTQNKNTTSKKSSTSTNTKKSTTKKKSSTSTSKKTTKKSTASTKKSTTATKKSTPTPKKNTTTTNKNSNTQTSSSITVTVYRSNGKVIKLDLEEYLIGVVSAEMPASFNIEALKAQALASRTYALKTIKNGKKLTDTVSTQVYKDNNQLKAMWGSSYNTYYNKVKNAVNSTKGMYISYNNQYIDAVFHSTSNGYTEDAINVWKNGAPYLKSVNSPWDKSVSGYTKIKTITYSEASKTLGFEINKNTPISISRNKSGRVSNIKINNKTYTGVELRTLLNLRSADFEISLKDKIEILTRGYGHGVGMSQYGANGMAKAGYNYIKIIKHYYTGVNISKIK